MKLEKGQIVLKEDIENLLNEINAGEFGDFSNNKYPMPKMELVNKFSNFRKNVIDGKYD